MSVLLCRFGLGGGMMERLTELKYDIAKLDAKIENMQKRIDKMAFDDKAEVGIKFLASTVSYLKELREYKQLEEQGLLLRLPCKVGNTIYEVSYENREFVIKKHIVKEFIYRTYRFPRIEIYCENENGFLVCNNIGKLDECLFLTQAEAEQKLKEMESD